MIIVIISSKLPLLLTVQSSNLAQTISPPRENVKISSGIDDLELQKLKTQAAEGVTLKTQLAELEPLKRQVEEMNALKAQLSELDELRAKVAELNSAKSQLGEMNNLR